MLKTLWRSLFSSDRLNSGFKQDYDAGVEALAGADFKGAERAFGEALRRNPQSAEAQFALGVALHRDGRRRESARCLARAYALNPGLPNLGASLLVLFDELSARDDAGAALDPPDSVEWTARAMDALGEGAFEQAGHFLQQAHALDKAWPFTHRLLGCLAALGGDMERADAWFRHAGACGLVPDANVRLSGAFLGEVARDSASRLPAMPAEAPAGLGEGGAAVVAAVVFVSGDCSYFRRFCFALLASAVAHGNDDLLWHFHIINPDQWFAEEFDELRAAHPALTLRLTVEERAFGSVEAAKTYFACARFVLLPDILALYRKPVLLIDFDLLVLGRLGPLIESMRGNDVALLRWEGDNWRIWDQFSASAVLAFPGEAGQSFVRAVAGYVNHFIAAGRGAWYLDQIALYAAAAHAQRLSPPARVGLIPAQAMANYRISGAENLPENTVFWSVTYNIKANEWALESDLFKRYLPAKRRLFGWTIPGSDQVFQSCLAGLPVFNGRRLCEMDTMVACLEQSGLQAGRRRRALDIGGHVGFWSYWLAEHFDRVDAFEPSAELQQCFVENVCRENVALHRCALGQAEGSVSMRTVGFNTGMSHVEPAGGGAVPVRTLDSFGFEDVDFIKMDAEGYELFILQGGARTLAHCRPHVLLEHDERLATRYGAAPNAALDLLCGMGAKVIRELHNHNYLLGWDEPAGPGTH